MDSGLQLVPSTEKTRKTSEYEKITWHKCFKENWTPLDTNNLGSYKESSCAINSYLSKLLSSLFINSYLINLFVLCTVGQYQLIELCNELFMVWDSLNFPKTYHSLRTLQTSHTLSYWIHRVEVVMDIILIFSWENYYRYKVVKSLAEAQATGT